MENARRCLVAVAARGTKSWSETEELYIYVKRSGVKPRLQWFSGGDHYLPAVEKGLWIADDWFTRLSSETVALRDEPSRHTSHSHLTVS